MNNTLQNVQFIKGKPYFLHKVVWDYEKMKEIREKNKGIRYYYTKVMDGKTKMNGWAIYFDRKILY